MDTKYLCTNCTGWFNRHYTPKEEKMFLKTLISLGYHYNKKTQTLTRIKNEF